MKRRNLLLASAAASIVAPWARSQGQVVRIIVPFAPGGSGDLLPRIVAPAIAEFIGQPVIVENRVGAGGSVGATYVARAVPDGLTLGVASVSTHGIHPAVMKRAPYDAIKDFAPVSNLARLPLVMAVHPSVPAKGMSDLIQLARDPKFHLAYGTPGVGSLGHMMGELFKQAASGSMVHVPYRGAGAALQDALAGQVQVLFDNLPSSLPHIKAGRLRAMAISWPARLPTLPDTATFLEAGLVSLNGSSWFGLVAPAGTPAPIVGRFQEALAAALARPNIRARIEDLGGVPLGNRPDAFAQELRNELLKWQAVAKAGNISLEAS